MTALAAVRKPGSKPVTATRVAGNEPAKIATPIKPIFSSNGVAYAYGTQLVFR